MSTSKCTVDGHIMAVSYNRLWKLLVDRKMGKVDLRKQAAITPDTMIKLRGNKEVTWEVLLRFTSRLMWIMGILWSM